MLLCRWTNAVSWQSLKRFVFCPEFLTRKAGGLAIKARNSSVFFKNSNKKYPIAMQCVRNIFFKKFQTFFIFLLFDRIDSRNKSVGWPFLAWLPLFWRLCWSRVHGFCWPWLIHQTNTANESFGWLSTLCGHLSQFPRPIDTLARKIQQHGPLSNFAIGFTSVKEDVMVTKLLSPLSRV